MTNQDKSFNKRSDKALSNAERAEKIVTKFNSEGACLSNTDETYLQELIVKGLDEAVREAHNSSSGKCDLCHDTWKLAFASTREKSAGIAEEICPDENYGDNCHESIPRRIRAMEAGK